MSKTYIQSVSFESNRLWDSHFLWLSHENRLKFRMWSNFQGAGLAGIIIGPVVGTLCALVLARSLVGLHQKGRLTYCLHRLRSVTSQPGNTESTRCCWPYARYFKESDGSG